MTQFGMTLSNRAMTLVIATFYLFVVVMVPETEAQFPRVCAENATKPNARCCPIPPGFTAPCGGVGRGVCLPYEAIHEYYFPPLPNHMKDDRINWPMAFFKFGCSCLENFGGYMCHECKWGYTGKNCAKRVIQVRKNIHSLSKAEQKRFIDLIDRSKYTISEYVALRTPDMDPIKNPQWINITIHDYIIWVHFYSARNTFYNSSNPCQFSRFHIDFSHEGAGFPTFHRLLILMWEREIQKLAGDDTFRFPYWDWSSEEGNCSVCTNDLFGAPTDSGHIDPASRFSKWQTRCHLIGFKQCRYCDPGMPAGPIIRRPGRNFGVHRLPREEEIDLTLSIPDYDVPPYDETATGAFRPCFEGSCPPKGLYMGMHGLVHAFMNGSFSDVATSTNDPIFILHHGFLDKLFELWIRRHRPHQTQFPARGAPLGHNRDAIMVPFFPRHFHRWYSQDSRGLGYTYDTFNYGKSGEEKIGEGLEYFVGSDRIHGMPYDSSDDDDYDDDFSESQTLMATAIATPLIIFAFLVVLVIHDRLKHNNDVTTITRVLTPNGESPKYMIVSDNEDTTATEDDEVVYCGKSGLASDNRSFLLNHNGGVTKCNDCVIPPEKKPLMDEIHE